MGIAFRDFVPPYSSEQKKSFLNVYTIAVYRDFDAAVREANAWIVSSAVRVISIETVVMPSVKPLDSQSSHLTQQAGGRGSGDLVSIANYYQFVRVWYEATV